MSTTRQLKRKIKGNTADIKEIIERAYKTGLERGREQGYYQGAQITTDIFFQALETLTQVKDIGPKRYQAILRHFDHLQQHDFKGE